MTGRLKDNMKEIFVMGVLRSLEISPHSSFKQCLPFTASQTISALGQNVAVVEMQDKQRSDTDAQTHVHAKCLFWVLPNVIWLQRMGGGGLAELQQMRCFEYLAAKERTH